MLQNGSFSQGWETLPAIAEANFLRNQRPHGWQVEWQEIGAPLYADANVTVNGIPECVHKLSDQLPENERLGGPDALILEGDAVYKIFNSGAIFGATLSQTVTGLKPGSQARLTVPIQVHRHGDPDAFGAESGVWVNGVGEWAHSEKMGDRQWYEHKIDFVVPENGQAEIIIRVKSKWQRPKDFFFDAVKLEAQSTDGQNGDGSDDENGQMTVFVQLPEGVQLRQGTCDEANVVEVNAGPGVKIELV
jgi:hypothetical protein